MTTVWTSLRQSWTPLALGMVGCLVGILSCALVGQVLLDYVPAPLGPKHPNQVWELRDRLGIMLFGLVAFPPCYIILAYGTTVERRGFKIVGRITTERSIVFVNQSVWRWMLEAFYLALIVSAVATVFGIAIVGALMSSIS